MWFKGQLQLFLTWALFSLLFVSLSVLFITLEVSFSLQRALHTANKHLKPSAALQLRARNIKEAASIWKNPFMWSTSYSDHIKKAWYNLFVSVQIQLMIVDIHSTALTADFGGALSFLSSLFCFCVDRNIVYSICTECWEAEVH